MVSCLGGSGNLGDAEVLAGFGNVELLSDVFFLGDKGRSHGSPIGQVFGGFEEVIAPKHQVQIDRHTSDGDPEGGGPGRRGDENTGSRRVAAAGVGDPDGGDDTSGDRSLEFGAGAIAVDNLDDRSVGVTRSRMARWWPGATTPIVRRRCRLA